MEIYRIENLTFTYPNREAPALDEINLTIKQGEFVMLCGPSGCGKTTLLRHLKPSASPHGAGTGSIYWENAPLVDLTPRDGASKIGFVMQSPDNQIVTDKVWHEMAFGLESLGMKTPEIRLRVAETASFFGIQTWFHKSVTELSGGQKQMLTLASIMALQPSVLILDEPTSQLDPIAAGEFLSILGKINRELGVTIILTEQRLEEALPLSTRAVVMEKGKIIVDSSPKKSGLLLREHNEKIFLSMPTPMRVWAAVSEDTSPGDEIPVTVREGADWLSKQRLDSERLPKEAMKDMTGTKPAIQLDEVYFKYEKKLPDVLKGLSFEAHYGEITAILGGNGTGKTTALSLMSGLHTPYYGKVRRDVPVYMLPQNPQSLFSAKTVREDLFEVFSGLKITRSEKQLRLAAMAKLCRLEGLLDNHPYDLSGGEQQRAALAKVLLLQPKILLLDEPTKGLDADFKQIFAAILSKLTEAGVAVVMASHDVEFCATHAHRCALFFDGGIVTQNAPRVFFSGNSFYTTAANRMARKLLPEAVTAEDIILALSGQIPPAPDILDLEAKFEMQQEEPPHMPNPPGLSALRKIIAGAFALLLFAAVLLTTANFNGLKAFISGGNKAVTTASEGAWLYVGIMLLFTVGIAGLTFVLSEKREKDFTPRITETKRALSKRTIAAAAVILLAIPVTLYVGTYFFGDRKYYFISLLIILETMLPFALIFEGRKPQARELVVIAVLCAIAVAGRMAFFMLPQFKPVIALVILSGVAFGGEAGFLVGTITAFVSNMFFGQGPWTPYQMFAFGIIGFLAGVLFHKGLLHRSPASLAVFGGFAAFVIYGGIMNPAQLLIYQSTPTKEMLLITYLQGIPFDLVHAAATVIFLVIISRPILEKLDRIKIKYGLMQ